MIEQELHHKLENDFKSISTALEALSLERDQLRAEVERLNIVIDKQESDFRKLRSDNWVHFLKINELQKDLEQSKSFAEKLAEVEHYKLDYERACQTVAEMHKAALGEIRGPKRGVVEDIIDLKAAAEKLAEALKRIKPELKELALFLKDKSAQGDAEHDACLIACGYLSNTIDQALAEYREQFPKANK